MSPRLQSLARAKGSRGSVLIIVIWVCLGLTALTVYFGNSMSSELRAADNRAAEITARQAAAGGTRYAAYILSQFGTNGSVPHREDYRSEELPIGESAFWFIGRDPDNRPTSEPFFGLVDECSKINLNNATSNMLMGLPNMTPELAEAIVAWHNSNQSGGGDNTYGRLEPPRTIKGAGFETVDELRLVYGATLDLLFGEDTNRNGALDDNENDGEQSAPRDNSDGLIQPGILEYVTVSSAEPNTRPTGGNKINIATQANRQARLLPILTQRFGGRAQQIMNDLGPADLTSIAEFWVRSRLSAEDFGRIRNDITVRDGTTVTGLININTASETVLACIPGIGPENASALVAYRLAHPDVLTSFTWINQILRSSDIIRAGRYITDRSYQFSADVVAVGPRGRGYCREKTIFDMTRGTPRIIYHQDLTAYGWALGAELRQALKVAKENRT
jgi:DNA uptake protein ComE-like DNA-binding protein